MIGMEKRNGEKWRRETRVLIRKYDARAHQDTGASSKSGNCATLALLASSNANSFSPPSILVGSPRNLARM